MPATYAHWHFGKECIETMPKNLQKIIHDHRDIYDFGVHGPDILFYNLNHNEIVTYGQKMHKIPARVFFEKCKSVYHAHEEKAEMLAYIVGFVSHFTLDSVCHSYVEKKRVVENITHNKVESEWDRHLIELDNRKTNLVDRSESLYPNGETARIISYFFPFSANQILQSNKKHKRIVSMLTCTSHIKYNFFKWALPKVHADAYADLFLDFVEYEKCKDSNVRLDKLKEKALKMYPRLLNNVLSYLNGKEELGNYFDRLFDKNEEYDTIEILPYEKELKYKVK